MPLLALYYVLSELEEYENFDAMINNFEKYYKSPINNIKVEDKEKSLGIVEDHYSAYRQEFLD